MINEILKNDTLLSLIKNEVQENKVGVSLDAGFYLEDGNLNRELLINLAIDNYYNSLCLSNTPPSIDNLLVINRGDNKFSVYLIELKDVQKISRISDKNIRAKFETTINNFMLERFPNEFNKESSRITDFNLWLVCSRFAFMKSDISDDDYEKRIKNSLMEKLMMIPPFKYKGKIAMINCMYNCVEIC